MINMLMIINFTLWEFNMAMESPPFIDDFLIHTFMYRRFPS